jgi:hypothetical protein
MYGKDEAPHRTALQIVFLDMAKDSGVIPHDPCLFRKVHIYTIRVHSPIQGAGLPRPIAILPCLEERMRGT